MSGHPVDDRVVKLVLPDRVDNVALEILLNHDRRVVVEDRKPAQILSPLPLHSHEALNLDDESHLVLSHLLEPAPGQAPPEEGLESDRRVVVPPMDVLILHLVYEIVLVLDLQRRPW